MIFPAKPFNIFKLVLLVVSSILLSSAAQAKVIDEHIYLVPMGGVDIKTVEEIKEKLPALLPMSVRIEVMPREMVPEEAYAPSRQQYNAEMIIAHMAGKITLDTTTDSVLIITDVDLFSQDLDFVFGAANSSKAIAVISLSRLEGEQKRVMKESLYELGRAWGLLACADPKCAMFLSADMNSMDKKKCLLCYKCKNKLHSRYEPPIFKAKIPAVL